MGGRGGVEEGAEGPAVVEGRECVGLRWSGVGVAGLRCSGVGAGSFRSVVQLLPPSVAAAYEAEKCACRPERKQCPACPPERKQCPERPAPQRRAGPAAPSGTEPLPPIFSPPWGFISIA